MRNLALFLLTCVLLSACSSDTARCLRHAETLMQTHPDSALLILKSIDNNRIAGRKAKADHALLYSQALDKNFIDIRDDSLIGRAVAYYARHRRRHNSAAKAYYYLGRVYMNRGDREEAAQAYMTAEELAGKGDDAYLQSLIYSSLGNLYYEQYSFEDALQMYCKAESLCTRIGHRYNTAIAIEAQGYTLNLLKRPEKALERFETAAEISQELHDTTTLAQLNSAIASLHLLLSNDIISARKLLQQNRQQYHMGTISVSDYPVWSSIYFKEHKLDSAYYFGILANKYCSNSSHQRLGNIVRLKNIAFLMKNHSLAYEISNKYSDLKDSIYQTEKTSLIQNINQKHRYKQLQQSYQSLKYRTIIIILGLLLAASIVLIFLVHGWHRMKEKLREYEEVRIRLETTATEFRNQYNLLKETISENDRRETMAMENLHYAMTEWKALLEESVSNNKQKPIKSLLQQYKEQFNPEKTRRSLEELRYVVNKRCHGIIDYLQHTYPSLTDTELLICALHCFGVSTSVITFLFDYTSNQGLYNRNSTICHKVGMGPYTLLRNYLQATIAMLAKEEKRDDQKDISSENQ